MSDTESSEDEIEPKLKYARLSNGIQNILSTSSATSVAVHPKVFIKFMRGITLMHIILDT